MKKIAIAIAVFFAAASVALAQQTTTEDPLQFLNGFENMSLEEMEALTDKMDQSLAESQGCLEKIDPAKRDELKQKGLTIQQHINTLCQSGKKAEAESYAQSEARKFSADPTLTELKNCAADLGTQFGFFSQTTAIGQVNSVCP